MTTLRRIDDARPPGPGRVRELVRVFRAAREACLRFTLDLHTAEEDADFFERKILPENEVWVAEAGGAVAGFIAFKRGLVSHLYVAPEHQGRGIGTRLLDVAKSKNDLLRLWVFQVNVSAIRFYEGRGFRVVERTDGAGNEEKQPDARMEWKRAE